MTEERGGEDHDFDYEKEPETDLEAEYYRDEVQLPDLRTVVKVTQAYNKDGTVKKILKAPKSDFVANLIYLDGAKFSFEGRHYLRPIYDRDDKSILLKTSRQVEKTTFLANNLVVTSAIKPYSKSLYVSPSHTQTRQFSNEKLRPALEKSPIIKRYFQDTSVSTQVFEKGLTNGAYIFLRSAFRSADRCLASGAQVLLADGSQQKIEDVSVGAKVISYDGVKAVVRPIIGKQFNGTKACTELTLESGQKLIASFDHKFPTQFGLVALDQITPDHYIPIPKNYLTSDGPDGDPLRILIGLLLGDGCLLAHPSGTAYRCNFNNNDLSLIELFANAAKVCGLDILITERIQNGKKNYSAVARDCRQVKALLWPYGILGKGQFTKSIPEMFFADRGALRDILRGLYDSNGWITCNESIRQAEVGFVTGSVALAKDVQRALLSLGIYSQIQYKPPIGRQRHMSFNVKIRNSDDIVLFHERVGLVSKAAKLSRAVEFIQTSLLKTSTSRRIPAVSDCNKAIDTFGISKHELWTRHGIQFRANASTGPCISVQKVDRIKQLTGDAGLDRWLDKSVEWVKVASTVDVGERETWDLEVADDHIFTANGIFTSNTRGISVSEILALDEIQDFMGSEIPVILECTSHYPQSRTLMAGTPKSYDNPIEQYWLETTQNEWMVPCKGCGKWNFLDEYNIGPTEWYVSGRLSPGPICKKCQKSIDIRLGRWESFNKKSIIQGYRIPQLMVPWIVGLKAQWARLLHKRDTYPLGQLYNEVLGLSYDNSSKPITRDQLMDCCRDYSLWDPNHVSDKTLAEARRFRLFAGIDWGEGIDGSEKGPTGKIRNASYTVLTIGGYINSTIFRPFLIKRYEGKEIDPDYVTRDITRICRALGVQLVGADWGHGWGVNNTLVRYLGASKVVQMQYLPKLKQKLKYDPIGVRYHLQRNFIMSEIFFDIKQGFIEFPKWVQFERFAKDILAIYAEYVEYRREIKYDHKPSDPDDFFHSLTYCKLAADINLGKSRRYTRLIDSTPDDVPGGE